MQLDRIATVLRLRTPWEAIDLGFALVRRYFVPVYTAWFAILIPLAAVVHLLCADVLWLAPWLIWWLKPLLDRIPLYILSQAQFGALPSTRQTFRALPALCQRQALAALTWLRLDPARSFHLPVIQLEGLSGAGRRARKRILAARSGGPAVWLTLTCLHLEIAVNIALVGLVWLLIPDFALENFLAWLDESPRGGQLLLNLAVLLGISLIEPFYVAAGFALYLNRRTWLEAWDLEIGFRRLGQRLQKNGLSHAATIAVLGFGCVLAATSPRFVLAEETDVPSAAICVRLDQQRERLSQAPSRIKRALAEVLQEPPFQRCELRQTWRFKQARKDNRSSGAGFGLGAVIAQMLEILLWIGLGIVFTVAIMWLTRRLPHYKAKPTKSKPPPAPVIHGVDIRPENFTNDAAEQAWHLWQNDAKRQALSLLYRASLARLMTLHNVQFDASATEEECLRCVRHAVSEGELPVFIERLTRSWQSMAYAHRTPADADMQSLCDGWRRHFAA